MKSEIHPKPLHRSEINFLIEESIELIRREHFALPPFAYWTPKEWQEAGPEWDGLRKARLGWDVTDFGWGEFKKIGRVLFTLRNGTVKDAVVDKPYAEKIIVGRQGQRAPAHFHLKKIEDIINRGGGDLVLQIAPSGARPAKVYLDGKAIPVNSEMRFRLKPGESLCIAPGTIHQFWGEETETGRVPLIGEVSSFCDDVNDNVFLKEVARFVEITNDEPPRFCLCNELPIVAEAELLTA